MDDLQKRAREAEAFETDTWAVKAILDVEIMTRDVLDPCAGRGLMGDYALDLGYRVVELDKYDWGCDRVLLWDFLKDELEDWMAGTETTVFMNPPFSLAQRFIQRAFDLNVRKIVCFQRFAWWESVGRRSFWKANPPNRIYICGDRASCWRFDLRRDEKGNYCDPVTGRIMGRTPTAHAWFIWERGQPTGPLTGHIYKNQEKAW